MIVVLALAASGLLWQICVAKGPNCVARRLSRWLPPSAVVLYLVCAGAIPGASFLIGVIAVAVAPFSTGLFQLAAVARTPGGVVLTPAPVAYFGSKMLGAKLSP